MDGKPPAAFLDAHWDVPQTVAWIVHRDPDMAAAASEREYRTVKPFGLGMVLLDDYGCDPGAATDELRAMLARGDLVCIGRPQSGGPIVEIPADQWADLEFASTDQGTETMGLVDPLATGSRWTQLRLRANDVMRVWPASAPHPRTDARTTLKRTELYRAKRIERFTARQRRLRQWIAFAEIAEWCSELANPTKLDEAARALALDRLERDLLEGVFDRDGRPRVLYLNPATPKARMTRKLLQDSIEHDWDGAWGRRSYLPCCWISADAFHDWCLRHHLPTNAPRFAVPQPSEPTAATAAPSAPAPKSGAPRHHRDAVVAALKQLYPDTGGNPSTTKFLVVHQDVNQLLKDGGQRSTSRDTLRRAIREVRSVRHG